MASINLQGDTSGSISISAPSIAGSNTLTLPATTQTLATQNSLGVRNLIINGDMRIAQRGTSFTGSGYSLDRWYSLSGRTTTQDSDVPSDEFLHSIKCVSSGNAPRIFGSVELSSTGSEHPIRSSTDYTLSGWVKGTSGESFSCRVAFANGVGQGDYRQISSLTLATLNGSWQYFTATFSSGSGIVGASDNCVELYFNISTHDTTFAITGVQLEVGTEATPFEHRPYEMELAICQRYYYRVFGNRIDTGFSINTTNTDGIVTFPVTMRTSPTALEQSGTASGYRIWTAAAGNICTSVPIYISANVYSSTTRFTTGSSTQTTGQGTIFGTVNATDYLAWSAEL